MYIFFRDNNVVMCSNTGCSGEVFINGQYLETSPSYICFVVNRFDSNGKKDNSVLSDFICISVPIGTYMTPIKYALHSFITHVGFNATQGHYTSGILSNHEFLCYIVNDEQSTISKNMHAGHEAYILIYTLNSTDTNMHQLQNIKHNPYSMLINKTLLFIDFKVIKKVDNGIICNSKNINLFFLFHSETSKELIVGLYYRIMKPTISSIGHIIIVKHSTKIQLLKKCTSRQVNIMLNAISFFELQLQIIHKNVSSKMDNTFFVTAVNSNVDKKFVATCIIRWEDLFEFQSCPQHKIKLNDGMCRKCPSHYYGATEYCTKHNTNLFSWVCKNCSHNNNYFGPTWREDWRTTLVVKNIDSLTIHKVILFKAQHPFVNQEETIKDEYYCTNPISVKNTLDLLLNTDIWLEYCRSRYNIEQFSVTLLKVI
jgi:hypothetical protein